MQTLFVMVKCQLGQAYRVADRAVEIEAVSEVHSISGPHDLMLKCFLDDGIDVGQFVVETIQVIPGVSDTSTLLAFKAFD